MRLFLATGMGLFLLWCILLWSHVDGGKVSSLSAFKLDPVYYNQPADTNAYFNFVLIPWDFQLFSFPLACNYWYPTCGGCIVYDQGWPIGSNFNPNGFPNAAQLPADSTLFLDTIKKPPVVEDSLLVQDSIVTPRKSWRYKFRSWFQNLRSAGRKYQDSTTNAKVRMDPKISEKGSPTAM